MNRLSANIDLLYTEHESLTERVAAAAADGFTAVELWGVLDRDVEGLAAAARDAGVEITSVLVLPRTNFTAPNTDLGPLFEGFDRTVAAARVLGCPRVVVGGGVGFPAQKRPDQLKSLAESYAKLVDRLGPEGVDIVIEPVNTRHDHPGSLLERFADGSTVARLVGSPRLKILADLYHEVTQGLPLAESLAEASDVIGYAQIADFPGRGEPGSGTIDWAEAFRLLESVGYDGPVGVECFPTKPTSEAVAWILDFAKS